MALRKSSIDGLCRNCLKSPVSPLFPNSLICQVCSQRCMNCGLGPVLDDQTMRCAACRCQRCGKLNGLRYINGNKRDKDGRTPMICGPCWLAENPDKACKVCNEREAHILGREEGKRPPENPNLCSYCIEKDGLKHVCFWCLSPMIEVHIREHPGVKKQRNYLECGVCRNTPCCFKDRCLPTRPCVHCIEKSTAAHGPIIGEMYFVQPIKFWDAEGLGDRKKNRSARHLSAEIEVAGLRNNGTRHEPKGACACPGCYQTRRMEISEYVRSIGGSVVQDESLP